MQLLHPAIAPWLQALAHGYRVRLLSRREHGLTIYLRTGSHQNQTERMTLMRRTAYEGSFAVFEALVPVASGEERNLFGPYVFEIWHDGIQTWLSAKGQHTQPPPIEAYFTSCEESNRRQKKWLQEHIFYQFSADFFSTPSDSLLNVGLFDHASSVTDDARQTLDQSLADLRENGDVTAIYLDPALSTAVLSAAVARAGMMQYQADQPEDAGNVLASAVCRWLALTAESDHGNAFDARMLDQVLMADREKAAYASQLSAFTKTDDVAFIRWFLSCKQDFPRMKMALALLMTYPGVPCLSSSLFPPVAGSDESSIVDAANMLSYCRGIISIRKSREELRSGAFMSLLAEGDVFAFARYTERQLTVVVCNRGDVLRNTCLDLSQLPVIAHGWVRTDMDGAHSVPFPSVLIEAQSVQIWVSRMQP